MRKNDLLTSTRVALALWAACSRSELPGWPTRSAIESALTGRGTGHQPEMKDDAKAVEAAVNKLYLTDRPARDMLLLHYLANGSIRQKIKHLCIDSKGYYARLESAEWAVKLELGY